ncbi:glycolate oxidase iron-sulfur subunit [Cupriavidus gilardii J11]|uniref:Glycolate oxidase iron-sulfur subunit n=1 Tax=Cupriavidus gilardii J11 TaxID=936133 RepID=A0A562BKG2_9BURK|nr:glycolate oxidase subunit GlcF [Cupriavidus gilardii]TWG85738.1 glycolate oxidase iron-sulfur subunit [Cupriavidus gilardii J11]
MQTTLADFLRDTPDGEEAKSIVGKCVHCGFCTATCPTYQLLGDELDGPRGRIYLMKQALEGNPVTESTRLHLDRCLTCRNCESTCPSGVTYGRLVDIGRQVVDDRLAAQGIQRPARQRIARWLLREGLTRPRLFGAALRMGQLARPLLPPVLRNKVPVATPAGPWPRRRHARKMLMLAGCVQPSMSPDINAATARVFDRLGVQMVVAPEAGCCGAIRYHNGDHPGGLDDMRRNIDAWWPHVEAGVEAIIMNASGCGVMVKEYGHLLRNDAVYAERAARISALTVDVSEVLPAFAEPLRELAARAAGKRPGRVAWHPPCTLQHGQQIRGKVESLLTDLGVDVKLCADSHLCCGSAGTYSVLQPELAYPLRDNKLANLQATEPEAIVSANIGCITHLQSGTQTPVLHWIELVDRMLG